jgi:hypothetical protein
VNNAGQVYTERSNNTWDDGYPSGGNYWSDYLTQYANATEIDHTGIGNTSYVIDANNIDRYPLMQQYAIPEFPTFMLLPFFMIGTILMMIAYKRKHLTRAL